MNFVLHLDDYRQESHQGIRVAQNMLKEIKESIAVNAVRQSEQAARIQQHLEGLDQDLDKLRELLEISQAKVSLAYCCCAGKSPVSVVQSWGSMLNHQLWLKLYVANGARRTLADHL